MPRARKFVFFDGEVFSRLTALTEYSDDRDMQAWRFEGIEVFKNFSADLLFSLEDPFIGCSRVRLPYNPEVFKGISAERLSSMLRDALLDPDVETFGEPELVVDSDGCVHFAKDFPPCE